MNEISLYHPDAFERAEKIAVQLSKSNIIPSAYQNNPGNCFVALDIANQIGMSPLAVMQNLDVIQGRPSWSAKFVIATINNSGKFSPLEFEIKELGEKEIEYIETVWKNGVKTKEPKKIKIHDKSCIAYATNKNTGKVLKSPAVSIEMAVKENWYTRDGSKWQTMPDLMLMYRAGAFFGRLYAPESLIGLNTSDELIETIQTEKEIPVASVSVSRADEVKEALKNIVIEPVFTIDSLKKEMSEAINSEQIEEIKNRYSGKFTDKAENTEAKKIYTENMKRIAMGAQNAE